MAQTSILGRIGQLVRANVNAMLDQAEDPEKMLDQLIRDFTNNIAEAEEAVAQTVGNLRLLEDDAREAREAAGEWWPRPRPRQTGPTRCAPRATRPRRTGSTASPRSPSAASCRSSEQVRTFDAQIEQQTRAHRPAQGRPQQAPRSSARSWSRSATSWSPGEDGPGPDAGQQTLKEVSVLDPTSELNRFEEQIRRQEAQARGMAEVAASSLEDQFAELQSGEDELEVEARLAELKGKALPAARPALSSGEAG